MTFIEFLDSKPADLSYIYMDNRNCPYAQYLKAEGVTRAWVTPDHWYGLLYGFIPWFQTVPMKYTRALVTEPHTYGEATKRAKQWEQKP